MTGIIALAYCSRPVTFSFDQVDDILAVSRRKNAQAGLTGALIYDNRTFLQWLEGSVGSIREVFARISRDERHTDVTLLTVRRLNGRWFPDWSMTAAVTRDQTLRSLRLKPHLSLNRFDPFGWSDEDAAAFMHALSDYLTRRPAPPSEALSEPVMPEKPAADPLDRLERHLHRLS